MGIRDLPKIINNESNGKAMKTYTLDKLRGWSVAVDASLMIYQTVIAIRSSGSDLKNERGELTSHLNGLFFKNIIFLENGIRPIYVFDGEAPKIKNFVLDKRKKIKHDAYEKLKELSDSEDEEYIKNFKKTFRPSAQDMIEAKILLDLMGIPYIDAPGEADVICAWLASRQDSNGNRYVKGVASDDSDMLPLGSPYLFKDMLKFMTAKKKVIRVISLKRTLVSMNITMEMFVDLCTLLGTDYCDRIDKIGPKTALKLIKKHKTLENVLDNISTTRNIKSCNKNIQKAFREQRKCMMEAKKYFNTALDKIDISDEFNLNDDQLILRKHGKYQLLDFMCSKHGFEQSRIRNGIARLKVATRKLNITRPNTTPYTYIINPEIIKCEINNDIDFISDDEL